MKLIFSPCSFIYYLFYHGIQSLVWPKWSTMADSNIFSLLFRIPFFLLCFSQFDQWKAWWLQFSVMTTADWTGDQITPVSMFCCKSCDPSAIPQGCPSQNWKRKSGVWGVGAIGSSSSHMTAIDALKVDFVVLLGDHTFISSLGEDLWIFQQTNMSSSKATAHWVAFYDAEG